MKDYLPLDLSKLCNAGVKFIGERARPAIGAQKFHELPFKISGNHRKCFLGFNGNGGARKPVTIRVGKTARYVLFAHTLLESKIFDGEPVGKLIAHYVIRYARHSSPKTQNLKPSPHAIRIPIRERFEIAIVAAPWGQLAFRAMPDQKQGLFARYEGRWDDAGYRQTEALQA